MDPYETLGVARDASPVEIRAAFRRLAKIHHPDRFIGSSPMIERLAQKRMSELNTAYQRIGPRFGPRPSEDRSAFANQRRQEEARRAHIYDRWEKAEQAARARAEAAREEAARLQHAGVSATHASEVARAAARAPVRQRPATIAGDGTPSMTGEFSRRLAKARTDRNGSGEGLSGRSGGRSGR